MNTIIAHSPVDRLLPLLQNVRRFGDAVRADCPLGHSSRGSLSVAVGHDGRALLKCHVGCEVADIAAAVGLRLSDLFQVPITRATPEERREIRQRMREANWSAALGVLGREATIVEVAAEMISHGEPLTANEIERVHLASARINGAREVLQ